MYKETTTILGIIVLIQWLHYCVDAVMTRRAKALELRNIGASQPWYEPCEHCEEKDPPGHNWGDAVLAPESWDNLTQPKLAPDGSWRRTPETARRRRVKQKYVPCPACTRMHRRNRRTVNLLRQRRRRS